MMSKPQLGTGPTSIRANVKVLMQPPKSAPRKKAIMTLARKHNISRGDAQFKQAIAIAKSQARKQ